MVMFIVNKSIQPSQALVCNQSSSKLHELQLYLHSLHNNNEHIKTINFGQHQSHQLHNLIVIPLIPVCIYIYICVCYTDLMPILTNYKYTRCISTSRLSPLSQRRLDTSLKLLKNAALQGLEDTGGSKSWWEILGIVVNWRQKPGETMDQKPVTNHWSKPRTM